MSIQNKKIAILFRTLMGGGGEKILLNLASSLIERGIDVDIVLSIEKGELLRDVPKKARIFSLNSSEFNKKIKFLPSSLSSISSLPKLICYLRQNKPDILLAGSHFSNEIAIMAKYLSGSKTIVVVVEQVNLSLHTTQLKKFYTQIIPWTCRVLYPWSNQIIGVSQGVAQDLAQNTGISPKRIEFIYNPVLNSDIFEKAKNPIDHPFFLPGKPPVILGVGRLDPQKDFSNLINAFAIVQKVTPARLVILGSGLLKQPLQALVKDLKLEDKVAFLGFVTNPYPYMINSSVFVLSSMWEGLPTVLIEALALKTPIVSTNCPSGPAEILQQGKYGHLVESKNPKALANSILKVLSGDKKAAPSDWLEQFTLDAATQKNCNIFDKILI